MNNKLTGRERVHLGHLKEFPCSCCDKPGPSEVHHIVQGQQYTAIPLCEDCHRGAFLGIHGQKRAWILRKKSEMDALNTTIRRLLDGNRA